MFGGELGEGTGTRPVGNADVDDHECYGLRVGYMATDRVGVEVGYLHDDTRLVAQGGLFEPDQGLGGLDLDILEGSVLFHERDGSAPSWRSGWE